MWFRKHGSIHGGGETVVCLVTPSKLGFLYVLLGAGEEEALEAGLLWLSSYPGGCTRERSKDPEGVPFWHLLLILI